MRETDIPQRAILAASCPGGMARQFRVQVCESETPDRWKLAGSFVQLSQADECARRLTLAGEHARVIACRSLPTAA
jgi:hypothetical protein